MHFLKILWASIVLLLSAAVYPLYFTGITNTANAQLKSLFLADGGDPLPRPPVVADGGELLHPPLVADGGDPLPRPPAA